LHPAAATTILCGREAVERAMEVGHAMTVLQRTPRRGDAAPLPRSHGTTARSRGGADHAAVLALQRSAGNAVVARVVSAALAEPLLQRKVGFEAELMVPSFGPAHKTLTFAKEAPRVSAAIASFLDGGVPYGTDISTKGGPIRIDSDHGDISRKPIVDILETAGYVTGTPTEPRTKLEFVTKAVDELAPGSDAELAEVKKALIKQLSQTVKYAKGGRMVQLDPPAKEGYFTGVPFMDFRRWLRKDYMLVHKALLEFREKKISDQVYLQATVGIIPSAIRAFMSQVGGLGGDVELMPPGEARKHLLVIVTQEMKILEQQAWFIQDDWVSGLGATSLEAFMGMIWLTYSYLLGDTLHRTSAGTASTAKNAVPFLIKHGPFDLVTRAGTQGIYDNPPPVELGQKIADWCGTRPYLKRSYWIGSGAKSAKGQGLVKKDVRARKPKENLITGTQADFVLGMLTGGGGATGAVMGKELPGLDRVSQDSGGVNVEAESFQQEAIPMEYRWITKNYKISEVAAAMDEIVGDVRQSNLRELSDEQKEAVYASF
jgi:hypothetical protein